MPSWRARSPRRRPGPRHRPADQAKSDTHFWAKSFKRELGDVLTLQRDIAPRHRRAGRGLWSPPTRGAGRRQAARSMRKPTRPTCSAGFSLDQGTRSADEGAAAVQPALQIQKDYAARVRRARHLLRDPSRSTARFPRPKSSPRLERLLKGLWSSTKGWPRPTRHSPISAPITSGTGPPRSGSSDALSSFVRATPMRISPTAAFSRRPDAWTRQWPRSAALRISIPARSPQGESGLALLFRRSLRRGLEGAARRPPGRSRAFARALGYRPATTSRKESRRRHRQRSSRRRASPRVSTSSRRLAHAYARFGKREEARQILEMLKARSRQSYVPSYYFVLVHAGLGDNRPRLRMAREGVSGALDGPRLPAARSATRALAL